MRDFYNEVKTVEKTSYQSFKDKIADFDIFTPQQNQLFEIRDFRTKSCCRGLFSILFYLLISSFSIYNVYVIFFMKETVGINYNLSRVFYHQKDYASYSDLLQEFDVHEDLHIGLDDDKFDLNTNKYFRM